MGVESAVYCFLLEVTSKATPFLKDLRKTIKFLKKKVSWALIVEFEFFFSCTGGHLAQRSLHML
jgi:hypothetical protein